MPNWRPIDSMRVSPPANAAGPPAGDVAALAGVPLPVEPRKRCVFVVACRSALPGMPLMVDPTGVWIRPEGEVYNCGVSPPDDTDSRAHDFEVDYGLFEEVVWPMLAHRVPAMEALKLQLAQQRCRKWREHNGQQEEAICIDERG